MEKEITIKETEIEKEIFSEVKKRLEERGREVTDKESERNYFVRFFIK